MPVVTHCLSLLDYPSTNSKVEEAAKTAKYIIEKNSLSYESFNLVFAKTIVQYWWPSKLETNINELMKFSWEINGQSPWKLKIFHNSYTVSLAYKLIFTESDDTIITILLFQVFRMKFDSEIVLTWHYLALMIMEPE